LLIGGNDDKQKKLSQQRHQEYNEMLMQQHETGTSTRRVTLPPEEHVGLPLGQNQPSKRLDAVKQRDYNEFLQTKVLPGDNVLMNTSLASVAYLDITILTS
jgi:hypothetical protein